jgi:hypothetical protein
MFPCPGCNQQVSPGVKFCPNCGFRLKSPVAGGKLLTGLPWVDGLIGFILFWVASVMGITLAGLDQSFGSLAGGAIWFGTPLFLGLGLRYRAMALGYIIGLGVLIALFLGLLVVCAIAIGAGTRH